MTSVIWKFVQPFIQYIILGLIIWGLWSLYSYEKEQAELYETKLNTIEKSIKLSERRLESLTSRLNVINQSQSETNENLRHLRESNEIVKEYFNTPVPDDVNRLLRNVWTGTPE